MKQLVQCCRVLQRDSATLDAGSQSVCWLAWRQKTCMEPFNYFLWVVLSPHLFPTMFKPKEISNSAVLLSHLLLQVKWDWCNLACYFCCIIATIDVSLHNKVVSSFGNRKYWSFKLQSIRLCLCDCDCLDGGDPNTWRRFFLSSLQAWAQILAAPSHQPTPCPFLFLHGCLYSSWFGLLHTLLPFDLSGW